jgi:hypothetical protein
VGGALRHSQGQEEGMNRRSFVGYRASLTLIVFSLMVFAENPAWAKSQDGSAPAASSTGTVVPRLVNFSGVVTDPKGQPVTGQITLVFSLYTLQDGGSPLWSESQKVQLDDQGHYTVLLGATQPDGLPLDLFTSGQAQWLGVQPELPGYGEQPRVLLVGMPYALKAADSDTLGGLPASAFVQANPGAAGAAVAGTGVAQPKSDSTAAAPANAPPITGSGTTNYLTIWTGSSTQGNSALYQTGSGSTAKVGLGTTTPAQVFQVNGASEILSTGSGAGFKFQDRAGGTSTYGVWYSKSNVARFWRSDLGDVLGITSTGSVGIGTTAPSATFEVNGTSKFDKTVTFAAGQTFPGAGTVTSVASGTGLTGGPITGSGTLSLASASCAAGSAAVALPLACSPFASLGANTFSGNQAVTGNLSATNEVSAGSAPTGNVASGTVEVDAAAQNSGSYSPGLTFGGGGEAIASNRTTFTDQYGLDFYTNYTKRMTINNFGIVGIGIDPGGYQLEVHAADNTAIEGAAFFGSNNTGSGQAASGMRAAGGYDTTSISYNSGGLGGWLIGGSSNVGYGGDGLDAWAGGGPLFNGYAGFFEGDVWVDGNLSKSSGSFKIDHPLDPANKYLYHSFVESPDMMNIYNGNVVLDGSGEAVVELPDWFGALNKDYRYQLTCIGGFAPVYIAEEIANNHFKIAGGKAGMKVSWTVTGVRQDAWANAHRIPVEVDKPANERGSYIHPELFGARQERSVEWARHPKMMKQMQAEREKRLTMSQANKR